MLCTRLRCLCCLRIYVPTRLLFSVSLSRVCVQLFERYFLVLSASTVNSLPRSQKWQPLAPTVTYINRIVSQLSCVYTGFYIILDVIKYCDHPRWHEKIPPGDGTSDRRWDLQLEVGSQIGGLTSDQRWDLQLEVSPPIRGETSNLRWHHQSEVGPPIRGGLCIWGYTGAPMLHVGISYSFEKKKRLFIVDYIKPSPVYQMKCKLVFIRFNLIHILAGKVIGVSSIVSQWIWLLVSKL